MKVKMYYTLLERCDGVWCPQFGSYSKRECLDERHGYRDNGTKARDLMVISTAPQQTAIDAYVKALNSKD